MPLPALKKGLLLGLLAGALLASAAGGAVVEYKDIAIHADGGFQPRTLPRHRFAPIEFHGHVEISRKGGGVPPALTQAVIKFDRDGRLDVAGLPSCAPEAVAAASTEEARAACNGAVVGTGTVRAMVSLAGGTVQAHAPLTIFNGPRVGGDPSVILHAHIAAPTPQTLAIVAPIVRIKGRYRYRVTIDVPPIAEGAGSLTQLSVRIGRHYRAGGRTHSYVSARCTDNVLETHGRFTFADGTLIDGDVEKYCRIK